MTEEAEGLPPRLGEVGSWTRLPNGGVGQVWALSRGRATVWVADGQRYIDLPIAKLATPVEDCDDVAMFDLDGGTA